jgi:hypothetical protein
VKHFLSCPLSLSGNKAMEYKNILCFIAIQYQLNDTAKIQNIFLLAVNFAKKASAFPKKREIHRKNSMKKSLSIRLKNSQPQTTPATSLKAEKQEEKAFIFAPGNGITDVANSFRKII